MHDAYASKAGDVFAFIETPPLTGPLAAHSIYFETLGDLGFPGFLLFLAMLSVGYRNTRLIRRLARDDPALQWAGDLASLLGISLIIYMVNGAMLSAAYSSLLYIMLTTISLLRRHVEETVGVPRAGRAASPCQPGQCRRRPWRCAARRCTSPGAPPRAIRSPHDPARRSAHRAWPVAVGRGARLGRNARGGPWPGAFRPQRRRRGRRGRRRLLIDPGAYYDCAVWRRNRLTIAATGPGVVLTDTTCQGKALWVVQGEDTTIRGVVFARARVPDGNGAGIRLEGRNLTVLNFVFVDDQVGLLAGDVSGSTLRIADCLFVLDGTAGTGRPALLVGRIDRLVVRHAHSRRAAAGRQS